MANDKLFGQSFFNKTAIDKANWPKFLFLKLDHVYELPRLKSRILRPSDGVSGFRLAGDVAKGHIEIDGIPINEYRSTYHCMTVVRQEAVLFHDSPRNNLTMYRDISDDRLIQMLNSLGFSKFANRYALNEIFEENGANLSGGEKKRICLARALLRDTDVLILDEPLANLDQETAEKIEDLLLSIRGKLLLVVSHQFTDSKVHQFDGVLNLDKI